MVNELRYKLVTSNLSAFRPRILTVHEVFTDNLINTGVTKRRHVGNHTLSSTCFFASNHLGNMKSLAESFIEQDPT